MNRVEKFNWHVEWAEIENKYGKMITYNLPRYNRAYANLTYQGYITKLLETKEYDVFLDVGAYVGLFSQVAAHNCKVVFAYEAHPFYYGILLTNMRFYHNVMCNYVFVTSGIDYIIDVPKMDESILGLVVKGSEKEYNISTTSLDEEINPPEDMKTLIKLDVEGHELDVLKGSEELLKKPHVHWIIDVHVNRGITSEDVLEFFKNRKITMISPKVIQVEGLEE